MSYKIDFKDGSIVGLSRVSPSSELMHWKYKRKYKGPSGQWVYVYDDGSMSGAGTTKTVEQTDTGRGLHTHITVAKTDPTQSRTTKSVTNTADTTTENITYGKWHIRKMNLQRRLSEVKQIPGNTLNRLLHRADRKYNIAGKQAAKNMTNTPASIAKNVSKNTPVTNELRTKQVGDKLVRIPRNIASKEAVKQSLAVSRINGVKRTAKKATQAASKSIDPRAQYKSKEIKRAAKKATQAASKSVKPAVGSQAKKKRKKDAGH